MSNGDDKDLGKDNGNGLENDLGAVPHLTREDLVGMGIDPNDLAAMGLVEELQPQVQPQPQPQADVEPEPLPAAYPLDQSPQDEAPTDEMPTDEMPVDEIPVDEMPVDEPPTETQQALSAEPNDATDPQDAAAASQELPMGYVITVGNEKGGSGKSTTSMHVIVALMRLGKKVGSIDLDNRQWTLTRYLANRNNTAAREGVDLPMPLHYYVPKSTLENKAEIEADEEQRFSAILSSFRQQCDFIVIDCPGTDAFMGRLGHTVANTIITPMNDSHIDFDMLAITDEMGRTVKRPGAYAEMVFEARKRRMGMDRNSIDWVVLRNRLSQLRSRNKAQMADAVENVAKRIGFRTAPGFAERVIYRELFPRGLTMMDLFAVKQIGRTTMSHIAARQEVRALIQALKLPTITDYSGLGG